LFYCYVTVERFIVHCEYGISRSAGVVAALDEHFGGVERSCIFDDDRYTPNWTCWLFVTKALKDISLTSSIKTED